MKFLALEIEVQSIEENVKSQLLKEEARTVLELKNSGIIKEIYFNEYHCAVIILGCESVECARTVLSKLPLVSKGYITFNIMELNPYTGFERLT